jgi:hypothetical protein
MNALGCLLNALEGLLNALEGHYDAWMPFNTLKDINAFYKIKCSYFFPHNFLLFLIKTDESHYQLKFSVIFICTSFYYLHNNTW